MTTISHEEVDLFSDEIDLRRYFQMFIKHWRWILLPTIVAGVVAAALSFFILLPTYEAESLVAITSPKYLMQFSPEFRAVAQEKLETEIYKTYPELAKSDELLEQVLNALAQTANGPGQISLNKMSVQASKTVGIIHLSVQDKDPATAALVVNTWAELYVKMLNRLYSGEEQDYGFYAEQLALAEADMDAAQEALAEFKARDRAVLVSSELEADIAALADSLATKNTIRELEQEITGWREQLASQSSSQAASQADELTSLLMQLEAFGILRGQETLPQFQISLQPIGEGWSVADQIAFLDNLGSLLQARLAEIDVQVVELQPEILRLQHELQTAQNEEERLTQDVKIARSLYESLSLKTEEARIASESQVGVSTLASKASVPNTPTGPHKLVNTVIGAGLGFAVGLVLAALFELLGNSKPVPGNDGSGDGS